jgi:hypothetical protein
MDLPTEIVTYILQLATDDINTAVSYRLVCRQFRDIMDQSVLPGRFIVLVLRSHTPEARAWLIRTDLMPMFRGRFLR